MKIDAVNSVTVIEYDRFPRIKSVFCKHHDTVVACFDRQTDGRAEIGTAVVAFECLVIGSCPAEFTRYFRF